MAPLIGITGRQLTLGMLARTDQRFRQQRIDSYYSVFAEHVARAGGIPVELPFVSSTVGVVDRLDGLLVTGCQDVHPARWGGRAPVDPAANPRWDHDVHDAERDDHEARLIEGALAAGVPVLGVCRGHQLLNVVLGGTLIEHLEPGPIVHATPHAAPSAGDAEHEVAFVPGSLAYDVYGATRVVNSWHHQAVDVLGRELAVMGRTPDGVIETIGIPGRPVVGVQWHPEWSAEPDPIIDWLVAAANERRAATTTERAWA
jgi:putative glutamine amidotransferase